MRKSGFSAKLKAFSAAAMGKSSIEAGNKSTPPLTLVMLPPSALTRLLQMKIQYPMFFCLSVSETKRTTCCGVLEFVATEGCCILPGWIMNNLLLEEGDAVTVENVTLRQGKEVHIQPFETRFTESNVTKAV